MAADVDIPDGCWFAGQLARWRQKFFLVEEEHVLRVRAGVAQVDRWSYRRGTLLDSLLRNFSNSIEITVMVLLKRAKVLVFLEKLIPDIAILSGIDFLTSLEYR
ncbi:unnamed protein product [Sphagnum tenellum]